MVAPQILVLLVGVRVLLGEKGVSKNRGFRTTPFFNVP